MRLLIITQKLDISDDNLGFFHRWVEEFAENAEEIFVIANFIGEHHLPDKVKIFSLGKEKEFGRIRRYFNFYRHLFKILPKSDAVFIHMISVWVILSWPLCKIFGKKIYLWYTHKSVTFSLRAAEKLADKIFTASEKSFRLPSNKVEIMGHGIDTQKFSPAKIFKENLGGQVNSKFRIITAGRIAPVKNLDILIEAAEILKNKNFNFEIQIAGAPITEKDEEYFKELKKMITEKRLEDSARFVGPIPYKEIEKFYQTGDLFVSLSNTGSIDKSVLEAMACGMNVLVSNESFFNILPEENFIKDLGVDSLAEKIKLFMLNNVLRDNLREIVLKNHDLKNLIKKLIENIM